MKNTRKREAGTPMPYTQAAYLLNPLRGLVLSPRALVRRLDLKPDFAVLELGPGPGYFSSAVARAVPRGKLLLIDVQQEMLDMAKKRLGGQGVTNVEYRRGDASALPVESSSLNVSFLVAVLGEVPNRKACLRELYRVLQPGGLLSVTEFKLGDPDSIALLDLQSSVEAEGFLVCSRHGRLFHYTLGFRKPVHQKDIDTGTSLSNSGYSASLIQASHPGPQS